MSVGGELAHAYYPSDGRAHFDDDEKFVFEGRGRGEILSNECQINANYEQKPIFKFSNPLIFGLYKN